MSYGRRSLGTGGPGGDTGLPSTSVYYCGIRRNECRCGFCDGRCGPNDGCPCNSCRDFLSTTILRPSNALSLNGLRNSDGYIVWKGGQRGGSGGDTGLSPSLVYYCGRRMNQCRCGECDSRCGPTNGCPCNSCKQLVLVSRTLATSSSLNVSSSRENPTSIADVGGSPNPSLPLCLMCESAPRNASFIHGSTAHFVSCQTCAERIGQRDQNVLCPVCRMPVDSIVYKFFCKLNHLNSDNSHLNITLTLASIFGMLGLL